MAWIVGDNHMKSLILSVFAIAAAAPAFAEDTKFYATVGGTFLSAEEAGVEFDLGAMTTRAGYQFTPNFSAEAEAMIGFAEEEISGGGASVEIGLNYAVGLFARAEAPVSEYVTLYARLGVVNAELEVEASVFGFTESESASETGAGYGAGAEFNVVENFSIYADYTRYDIEETEIDGLSFGGRFRF